MRTFTRILFVFLLVSIFASWSLLQCKPQEGEQVKSEEKVAKGNQTVQEVAQAKDQATQELAQNNPQAAKADEKTKYVGVKKCSTCHKAESRGNQFKKWEESKHASAFKVLASDEAKKVAKEKGIDDPQKSEACLKCHVTAFGVKEELIAKGFEKEAGIQCESCHGAGEKHVKARMAADDPEAATDEELAKEISRVVKEETCTKCHNKDSPSYKEFKFEDFKKKIDHPNPKKKR